MLKFTKLEGAGNDFVVVDLRDGGAAHGSSPSPNDRRAAAALCDRHFGVGADGVMVILPPTVPEAAARMRVLNADGSEAEMCGNGIRCVAKYLYERDARMRQPVLPIETGAGLLRCGVTVDARRHVTHVSVAMGRPRVTRAEIPMEHGAAADRCLDEPIEIAGRGFRFTAVSMGNPHAVVFVDGDEPLLGLAQAFGPSLERHSWFPRKTNAEFARVRSPTEIDLVVWERGCGITQACGTGASATAVAACLTGRAHAGSEVAVNLPGGTLHITVEPGADGGYAGVTMRGPADEVFEGEMDLAALLVRAAQRGKRA